MSEPAQVPADRDAPLRADVSYLGRLLGQVLVEQGGEGLLASEERLRALAKQMRAEGVDADEAARAEAELWERTQHLDGRELVGVIRAFSVFFQLVNTADQHHRVRRRRWRDAEREEAHRAQPESLAAAFAAFAERAVPPERIASVLDRLSIELVVTPHPTEVSRRTVLAKHMLVAECLDSLDNSSLSPRERRETEERLLEEITILWQSDEMRSARPRVIDEVRRALFFFEEVLFDTTGTVHEELERLLDRHYPGLRPPVGFLRYGSWAGGDQDGNPNCTPELVGEALDLHTDLAHRMLRERVRALAAGIGISTRMAQVSEELDASIAADERAMPETAAEIGARNASEPYRRKLSFVWERLDPRGERPYARPAELVEDLEVMRRSLEAHGGAAAGGAQPGAADAPGADLRLPHRAPRRAPALGPAEGGRRGPRRARRRRSATCPSPRGRGCSRSCWSIPRPSPRPARWRAAPERPRAPSPSCAGRCWSTGPRPPGP